MEDDADSVFSVRSLATDFSQGIVRGVVWNATTLAWAKETLPTLHLPELTLMDNVFDDGGDCSNDRDNDAWYTLLTLIVQHVELKRFTLAQADLSPYLENLAKVFGSNCNDSRNHHHHNNNNYNIAAAQLQELELVARTCRLQDNQALHLQTLVQLPSLQSLRLSLSLKQKDYRTCLLALQQGWDKCQYNQQRNDVVYKSPPRIALQNVGFPDHEYHLHRFLALLCETPCIDALQLNPRRRRVATPSESMRIGPGFLPGLVRLLALGKVRSLAIQSIVLEKQDASTFGGDDPRLLAELRQALQYNTTLEHLAMPYASGMCRVWQQAIFPALASGTNQTVTSLVMGGHEVGLVAAFLQQLPQMTAIRRVQAPWRDADGPLWIRALEQSSSLCHARFLLPMTQGKGGEPQHESGDLALTRQLIQRNLLLQSAKEMVRQDKATESLIHSLVDLSSLKTTTRADCDVGLDARFTVLRESLTLFTFAMENAEHAHIR